MSMNNQSENSAIRSVTGWDKGVSPYHPGEVELHTRLGRAEHQEAMARVIHHSFIQESHREFFQQLPFVIAGSVDVKGAPWASALFGTPGFLSTPDDSTLVADAHVLPGDPFETNVETGAPVSFVGIELSTRRRIRLNGIVGDVEANRVTTKVVQSYGNCPQYIHTREPEFTRNPAVKSESTCTTFKEFDAVTREVITRADTFFVASHNPVDDPLTHGGVDVNHRGGNPGFVKIDGNTLTVPDFKGNFAFNTLGNFVVNPRAGLLFIDFQSGDFLQLTGTVELLWDKIAEISSFKGAERAWRFHLDYGHHHLDASPLNFIKGDASPRTLQTGDWN